MGSLEELFIRIEMTVNKTKTSILDWLSNKGQRRKRGYDRLSSTLAKRFELQNRLQSALVSFDKIRLQRIVDESKDLARATNFDKEFSNKVKNFATEARLRIEEIEIALKTTKELEFVLKGTIKDVKSGSIQRVQIKRSEIKRKGKIVLCYRDKRGRFACLVQKEDK